MKLTLLENESSEVGRAIDEALEGAETFDAAVAFVRRSGIDVAPGLRDFAESRRLRLLAGTDFSQTEIEAVDDLSRAGADSRVFVEGFARSCPPASARTFHPKIYLATQGRRVIAIVGSANLTRGGFFLNREACIRVEGDPEEPILRETARYFESLWNNPYAVPVNDKFREEYRQIREARRRAERAAHDVPLRSCYQRHRLWSTVLTALVGLGDQPCQFRGLQGTTMVGRH
jgi:HKD family nuclease